MDNFPSKEYELIQRLQTLLPPANPNSPYEVMIGDDAAIRVNKTAGERLIITADVSVENVHFSLDTMTFEEIGYRSMVSNLSDCAAMGARPDGAVVQLVFPKIGIDNVSTNNTDIDNINRINTVNYSGLLRRSAPRNDVIASAAKQSITIVKQNPAINNVGISNVSINTVNDSGLLRRSAPRNDVIASAAKQSITIVKQNPAINNSINVNDAIEQIYAGFSKACKRWNFPVVGGDLSGGAVWTIGITLIGSAPPGSRLLKRAGISDGDALWATGIPGESAAGLAALSKWGRGLVPARYKRFVDAHVAPEPAVNEGAALAANPSVHAMMDLSDGLSKDIATLCFDNRLGFIFDADAVKSAPPAMIELANDLQADHRGWFYHGGEEYELLFACDPSFDPRGIDKIAETKPNLTRLGCFTSKTRGVLILCNNGETEELQMKSWDHVKSNNKNL